MDSSCSEQEEEPQPLSEAPVQKSGAAAAAAVEAAKVDVGRRETARKTWKDPVEAARQLAAGVPAQGEGDSAQQADGPQVQGSGQPGEAAGTGVGAKGRRKGGAKGKQQAAGGSQGSMQRKRTRSGVIVECEDI